MENNAKIYPYNDAYMVFDSSSNQYILTQTYALEQLGIDLSSMVNERNAINQQVAVSRILKMVSNQIYNFIHSHCFNTHLRDSVIALCPSARDVIKNALSEQLIYVVMKGDLSRSTDINIRQLAIDENAKAFLMRIIPEVGYCLLYTGC